MEPIKLDGNSLSLEQFEAIVDGFVPVTLDKPTLDKLSASRKVVEDIISSGEVVYGINTGFGVLSSKQIDHKDLAKLQENLIRSHCCGVGENHDARESRAILLLRTNVLAKGFSGVRPELAQFLVEMLNHQIHPVIPKRGSVGASGDLSPLAHLASVVIGEGAAYDGEQIIPGAEALERVNLQPLKLKAKEGLSLINGTQQMTATAALYLLQAEKISESADLIATASLEGVLGSPKPFESWIHDTRPYPGQKLSAQRLESYMVGSEIRESHQDCTRVQDPYSFRCIPQVHGAANELIQFVRKSIETEMNASTDNPLVNYKTGEIVSNGNFHGQPVAYALDILAMALCEFASLSERRISKVIDPTFSDLPTFLVKNEGLNSGFMMAHVTCASLVAENRALAHPASTDSIPTNNEKEDHVSMGPISSRKTYQILKNTEYVLGTEILVACQALDFRAPLKAGKGPQKLLEHVRREIPSLEEDRYLSPDMERAAAMIRNREISNLILSERLTHERDTRIHRDEASL